MPHPAENSDLMYRLLVQSVVDYAIYMLTPEGIVSNWNAGAARAKGYTAEEIVGRHFSKFYTGEDLAANLPMHNLEIARNTGRFEDEGWRVRKDGTTFWAHVVIDALHDDDGRLLGFAKITRDVTERRQQQLHLIAAKEQMSSLLQFLDSVITNMPASVLVKDIGTDEILLANAHARQLFSASGADLKGQLARECLSEEVVAYLEQQIAVSHRQPEQLENTALVHTAQGPRHLRSRTVLGLRPDAEGEYALAITEDVTQELAAYARIHHMAHHDGLTNLPNRTFLNARLESAITGGADNAFDVALLCLDLDHFKHINDTYGHGFGDKILLELSNRLRTTLRSGDTLARLGGDEFAIVLPQVNSLQEAKQAAQRLLDAVAPAFIVDGQHFSVGISIGIAMASRKDCTAEQMLRYGDLALYEAKRTGRNRFELFHPALEKEALQRRQVEVDLRHALDYGGLEMHYQPVVERNGEQIAGYEALMRWQHPTRGEVAPLDFIPIAEESGLIHELGTLALRMACQEAASWEGEQTVAVNLSPVQFQNGDLVEIVAAALAATGLPPHRLELEITESVLLENSEANLDILRALKKLGIRIALDDFGTGYSSLGYLRSFVFDKIKIDKSFVRDINHSREALSIIRAITGLSSSLLMEITAEGVETEEQFLRLQAEGCSHYQGYFFGRPQAAQARVTRLPAQRQQIIK